MATKLKDNAPPTNGLDQNVFLEHRRLVHVALQHKVEADSLYQHSLKRAKAAGLPLEAFKRAMKSAKRDADEVKIEETQYLQMMAWLGKPIGEQASFGLTAPTQKVADEIRLSEASDLGYAAALRGAETSEAPYQVGTDMHAEWCRGFNRGTTFVEKRGQTTGKKKPLAAGQEQVDAPRAGAKKGQAAKKAAARKAVQGAKATVVRMSDGKKRKSKMPAAVPTVVDDEPVPTFGDQTHDVVGNA